MRRILVLAGVVVLTSASAMAEEKSQGVLDVKDGSYTVKKGDTLWGISDQYYKDAHKWPRIWEKNPKVKNPHLIYPGDIVIIEPSDEKVETPKMEEAPASKPVLEEAKTESAPIPVKEEPKVEKVEEVVYESVESIMPAKKKYKYPGLKRLGFIIPNKLKPAGIIIGAVEEKIMLSIGDEIYLTIEKGQERTEGTVYTIYRNAYQVFHPVTKKLIGEMVEVAGKVEIERVFDESVLGRVIVCYDNVLIGDMIGMFDEPAEEIMQTSSGDNIEGYLIANVRRSHQMSQGDIVYLDKGKKAGVEAGNIFIVSQNGKVKKGVKIPPEDVASLLVLSPQDDTSSALVVKSKKSLFVGDMVRTVR